MNCSIKSSRIAVFMVLIAVLQTQANWPNLHFGTLE